MSHTSYSGTEVLENLTEAYNYNNALKDLVETHTPKAEKVLDFGAGIGTFSDLLRDSFQDLECLEIDIDQGETLKSKGYKVFTDLDVIPDASYDAIYSLNVFEHIENDREVFENLLKKVKPGGRVVLFLPAFNSLYSHFDKFVGHFRRYDKKMLMEMVTTEGASVEKMHYFDSIGFVAAFLFKYIKNEEELPKKSEILFYDKVVFPFTKIVDAFLKYFFGKNIYCVITKK